MHFFCSPHPLLTLSGCRVCCPRGGEMGPRRRLGRVSLGILMNSSCALDVVCLAQGWAMYPRISASSSDSPISRTPGSAPFRTRICCRRTSARRSSVSLWVAQSDSSTSTTPPKVSSWTAMLSMRGRKASIARACPLRSIFSLAVTFCTTNRTGLSLSALVRVAWKIPSPCPLSWVCPTYPRTLTGTLMRISSSTGVVARPGIV